MCGAGSAPKAPEALAQAPTPAPLLSESAGSALRKSARTKRGATQGGTITTAARGLNEQANTQTKTLLGG